MQSPGPCARAFYLWDVSAYGRVAALTINSNGATSPGNPAAIHVASGARIASPSAGPFSTPRAQSMKDPLIQRFCSSMSVVGQKQT
jgi:hypothetical protein